MANLKASSGQIDQSSDFNFTGDLKKDGVDVAVISAVISMTGGGVLTARRINELRDGSLGYTLPLANSVDAGVTLDVTLNVIGVNPKITATGSDTITNIEITDTSIVFDAPTSIKLASNGVDNWRFL